MKRHHAYVIKWDDSAALKGWRAMAHAAQHCTAEITSIGWLVAETKTHMTITTSIAGDGQVMDALTIPKAAITKRTRLERHIIGSG